MFDVLQKCTKKVMKRAKMRRGWREGGGGGPIKYLFVAILYFPAQLYLALCCEKPNFNFFTFLWPNTKNTPTCKMPFSLHHPSLRLKIFTPQKCVIFSNAKFATKQQIKNHSKSLKHTYKLLLIHTHKNTLKVIFPSFPRTFTTRKAKF